MGAEDVTVKQGGNVFWRAFDLTIFANLIKRNYRCSIHMGGKEMVQFDIAQHDLDAMYRDLSSILPEDARKVLLENMKAAGLNGGIMPSLVMRAGR